VSAFRRTIGRSCWKQPRSAATPGTLIRDIADIIVVEALRVAQLFIIDLANESSLA
jgi:hypothetical protein